VEDRLEQLRVLREAAQLGGGAQRIAQQHARGKLTARERLALLLDPGSFQELGALARHGISDFGLAAERYPGDGVVTGFGKINERRVAVYAQDFTILGGSFSEVQAQKITRLMDLAMESGIPIIGLNDSGGARIQEGVRSLAAYGEVFARNVLSSGIVPQISVILGPCAGGAVYSPALTDFVIMARDIGYMFLTGPEVVRAVSGREVTVQQLGGADIHHQRSGVAHLVADDERGALDLVKALLSYLPQNNTDDPPHLLPSDSPERMAPVLNSIVPEDERIGYDMHTVVAQLVDEASFLELQPAYAANVLIGFARLDGYPVGIVANNPAVLAGALDIDSSDKIARFVRICDAYNLPVITLVDCPGYLPGIEQEYGGVIRHGAKIIYAYAGATVPKISVVLRKAIGGAYIALSSKQMRCDLNFAWPTAQIAVMGAEGAARVLWREELKQAADPIALERQLIAEYRERFFNPYHAADLGQIDEIIEPAETRPRLIRGLEILRTKVQQNPPRKHGLYPS